MTPQEFILKFREAFGEAAPLPIAFWYGDTAVNTECRVPRCMIGAIRKRLLTTAEIAGCTIRWHKYRHYILSEFALVGEATVLAMRTNINTN